MLTLEMTTSMALLARAAVEAAEEPDTIMRRPEVIDVLEDLADQNDVRGIFERVTPGLIVDPEAWVRALAQALAPFRNEPLDDQPELVGRLALVAWILQSAAALESVSESAVVYA
jgi:hypothetical protein